MKIVINSCFGGFGVSSVAVARYNEIKGRPCFLFHQENFKGPFLPLTIGQRPTLGIFYAFDTQELPAGKISNDWWKEHSCDISSYDVNRADPILVQVVEELGALANGFAADLRIVEIPDGVDWEISEYDGMETIHEKHRSWS